LPLAPHRGPAINVFNIGGGRCRTFPPAPPGGLPSTSSTPVVAAAGPYRQHPQGGRHRHLQLWWWPLPDLAASTPEGACHQRLQLCRHFYVNGGPSWAFISGTTWIPDGHRWWPLSDHAGSTPQGPAVNVMNFGGGRYRTLPPAPPGGPPSTSSTSVVATFRPSRQHPLGGLLSMSSTSVEATVRPCCQHPQGAHHRRLQLQWWPLSDLAASTPQGGRHRRLQLRWWPLSNLASRTPRGPAIDVFNFGGGRCRIYRQHLQGARH
jgi:hypothetical protein